MKTKSTEYQESDNPPLDIADDSKSLTPHRCPVCNGNGLVPNGFYMQTSGHWTTSSITAETCRSCNGTGIVWANIYSNINPTSNIMTSKEQNLNKTHEPQAVNSDLDAVVPSLLSDTDYWKQRCLLAEKCLEESPCDPDITLSQRKA